MLKYQDFLSLEYRQDLDILIARWHPITTSEQFRTGYNQILETGNPEKIHCWLIDTRRRGPATPTDENWFFTEYLPRFHAKLKQKHYLAVLHTPSHYIHIRDVIGFQKLDDYNKNTLLTMNFFDAEQKAVEWLVSNT